MSLPEIACPDCGYHFNPLPPKPTTPPEWANEQPALPLIAARIAVVQGMLANLRDSLRRSYGFVTDLRAQPGRTWVLTVTVPDQRAITDDVTVIDAEPVPPQNHH